MVKNTTQRLFFCPKNEQGLKKSEFRTQSPKRSYF